MANFDRLRPLGEWNFATPITQAELEAWDAARPAMLNGKGGSVHAPTAPIIVGGAGLQGGLHAPTIITLASSPTLALPNWAQLVWGWLVAGGGSGGAGEDEHGAGGGGMGQLVPFSIRVADLIAKELVFAIGDGSNTSARGGSSTLTVDGTLLLTALGGVSGLDSDPASGQAGAGGNGFFGGGQGADPNNIGGRGGGSHRTGYTGARLGFGEAVTGTSPGTGWGSGLTEDASFGVYASAPIHSCRQHSDAGNGGTASSGFNGGGGGGAAGVFDPSVAAEDGDPTSQADPGASGSGKGGRGYGAGAGGSNGIAGYAASVRSKGAPGCAFVMMA